MQHLGAASISVEVAAGLAQIATGMRSGTSPPSHLLSMGHEAPYIHERLTLEDVAASSAQDATRFTPCTLESLPAGLAAACMGYAVGLGASGGGRARASRVLGSSRP